ncbi:MAG: glycosyltransferase [Desulfosarcina sp.]
MSIQQLTIAMLSIHSSPNGALGTRDTGGMSVYVNQLAREMGRNGHRVDVFTHRGRPDDPPVTELAANVRLISLDIGHGDPVTKSGLYACADDIMAAIDDFRRRQTCDYDVIHSHYWISGHVGRMAQQSWQRPHVVTFHTLGMLKANTGVGDAEPTRRLAVERELVLTCQGLLAPCEGEKSNLMHYYDADEAKIAMVPGGVDRQRFRPMPQGLARQQLGIVYPTRMLLTIGRLTPQKGQRRVVEALPHLGKTDCSQLMVVGGGRHDPEQQRLQDLAAATGVQPRVRFCGSVPHRDLPVYYAAADIVVQASHYESFGLVGLEALACGRKVVSTPVGVMAELARRRQPGVVLADGSPAALAAGIAAAEKRASEWPADLIRRSVDAYGWDRSASAALAVYRSALQAETATATRG